MNLRKSENENFYKLDDKLVNLHNNVGHKIFKSDRAVKGQAKVNLWPSESLTDLRGEVNAC